MTAVGRVLGALLLAAGMTLLACCVTAPAAARAPSDEPVDVLVVVDDTASMSVVIEAAKAQIAGIVGDVRGQYGDSRFALATVGDYDRSWELRVPLTDAVEEVTADLQEVAADSQGNPDGPEAYARAIHAAGGSEIGWRPDARRVVLLVADDLPKDDDVNDGVPAGIRLLQGVWRTSADDDPPENALDWQEGLQGLRDQEIVLTVLFSGDPAYLPYWEFWTREYTAGAATAIDPGVVAEEEVGDAVTDLIARGADAEPPGSFPTGPVLAVVALLAALAVAAAATVGAPTSRQKRLVRRHVRVTGHPDAAGRHGTSRNRDAPEPPTVLIRPREGHVEHRVMEGAD